MRRESDCYACDDCDIGFVESLNPAASSMNAYLVRHVLAYSTIVVFILYLFFSVIYRKAGLVSPELELESSAGPFQSFRDLNIAS